MKDILQPLITQFVPFAKKRMGFHKPPRIFLRDDPQNAQDPLGKTAYYDPQQMSVTLYVSGRHPKDIMRSLSHELIHHTQNCNGQFDNSLEVGEGYAQNDSHLREMERQAYEQGNLCFRDWEDSIKNTIYNENLNVHIQKEGFKNMSTKDWKNKELSTLLNEKWGFSFNLLNESVGAYEAYVKHTALNLGQAARDLRYLGEHPDEKTVLRSFSKRIKQLATNLFYAAIPPQSHHTPEELEALSERTVTEWFLQGYAPWKYGRSGSAEQLVTEAKIRKIIRRMLKEAVAKKERK